MSALQRASQSELPSDGDAALRQLYADHALALRSYVVRFTADPVSAEDIVQETFIRAWRHLPGLTADKRPVRLAVQVARNLLIDADRAARSRPVTVPGIPPRIAAGRRAGPDPQPPAPGRRSPALVRPAHRTVLVGTFYRGSTLTSLARQLGVRRAPAVAPALRAARGAAVPGRSPGHVLMGTHRPGRFLITGLLVLAAALDLTRCGIVVMTARHGRQAAGLVAVGLAAAAGPGRSAGMHRGGGGPPGPPC
jgi:RNA polymerase sigma-70 factor (ECF subfamily)